MGGLDSLVELLTSSKDEKILEKVTGGKKNLFIFTKKALLNMMLNSTNRRIIRQIAGIKPLIKLMNHSNSTIVHNTAGALWNMSVDRENKKMIKDYGGMELLNNYLKKKLSSKNKEESTSSDESIETPKRRYRSSKAPQIVYTSEEEEEKMKRVEKKKAIRQQSVERRTKQRKETFNEKYWEKTETTSEDEKSPSSFVTSEKFDVKQEEEEIPEIDTNSLQVIEDPIPVGPSTDMYHMLKRDNERKMFKDYSIKEYSPENIEFWERVQEWKKMPKGKKKVFFCFNFNF